MIDVISPAISGPCQRPCRSARRLHAPISNPPRVFAIGLNYRDHAKESGMAIPTTPVVFFKLPTAIIGPGEHIVLPSNSTEPDYEAEFAFVIGKGGYRIPASAWREHVYGYTIVNDVSASDVQFATSQWSMSKSFPTFCPLGPAIVTADEIADPHNLNIELAIDGVVHQSSNTRELDLQDSRACRIPFFHYAAAARRHRLHWNAATAWALAALRNAGSSQAKPSPSPLKASARSLIPSSQNSHSHASLTATA